MSGYNVVGYLRRERRPFAEEPFNVVDALVFSMLSYLRLELHDAFAHSTDARVKLHEVLDTCSFALLTAGGWMRASNEAFCMLSNLRTNPRYRDIELILYRNEHALPVDKQFAAVTIQPGDGRSYLVFRGTDGTLVGWKENFNMCFKEITPSQRSAVEYASGVASAVSGPLVMVGHSKGGSLAQYATLCVADEVFERIEYTYNFDGPSYLNDPSPRVENPAFAERFFKGVPEASLFGLLMERSDGYHVIQSDAFLHRQHVPFSWVVDETEFLYAGQLSKSAQILNGSLSKWMQGHTVEERGFLIDTIYQLILSTEAKSLYELKDDKRGSIKAVREALKGLDSETHDFVISILKELAGVIKHEARTVVRSSGRVRPEKEHA